MLIVVQINIFFVSKWLHSPAPVSPSRSVHLQRRALAKRCALMVSSMKMNVVLNPSLSSGIKGARTSSIIHNDADHLSRTRIGSKRTKKRRLADVEMPPLLQFRFFWVLCSLTLARIGEVIHLSFDGSVRRT